MKLKGKKALVYGLSVSGEWASKLLLKHGAEVYVYDDNPNAIKNKNFANCFLMQKIEIEALSNIDFVVVSPSIEPNNPNLKIIQTLKIRVFSELEFASQFAENLLAITGTNGKTTTVQLITEILNKRYKAVACGNIGYPLSRAVIENKRAIKVVEVSSFMLEHAKTFHPHIATVLNVRPDHLIRHKTFENYFNLKKQIFSNLNAKDFAVVNLDKNIHPTTPCATFTYSISHPADVYLKDGYICLHQSKIIAVNRLSIKGKHNIQNAMCAVCFATILKIPNNLIAQALENFKPEDFRCQQIGEVCGIKFVNDSKSTNIASTLACVESVRGGVVLLLGGSNKGLDYVELFKKLSHKVKHVVAFGQIADNLIEANNNIFAISKCASLRQAFEKAVKLAMAGDSVVLSPASASYDEFENYIQRGNAFNLMVKEYECQQA